MYNSNKEKTIGNGPASEDIIRELLQGSFDMHVHSNPDVVIRKVGDVAVLCAAKAAGMAGVVIKSMSTTSTARAAVAQEAVEGVQAFGGIVLNRPMGGLNPFAVQTELALGAKIVWLPTRSALNDIKMRPEVSMGPVPLFDDAGKFMPELHEILEMIAQKDVVLATGHASCQESEKIVALAKQKGVKKIVITHPENPIIDMPAEMQKSLARQGVFFEWVACNLGTITGGTGKRSPEVYTRFIRGVGAGASVMATDFGQPRNAVAAEGLRMFIGAMLGNGISPDEIKVMVKDNPKKLLNIA